MKLLGIISTKYDIKDQLLIKYSALDRYWIETGSAIGHYIRNLQTSKKHMTCRTEVLYNIHIVNGIPLNKLC